MHYRMLHSIPGVYPLDASKFPPSAITQILSHDPRVAKSPLNENHRIRLSPFYQNAFTSFHTGGCLFS